MFCYSYRMEESKSPLYFTRRPDVVIKPIKAEPKPTLTFNHPPTETIQPIRTPLTFSLSPSSQDISVETGQITSRKRLFKLAAGVGAAATLAAIPETRALTLGTIETVIQTLLTRHPQIEPLSDAGEFVLTRDGIPYCNKLGENLYHIMKHDFPKVFNQPNEAIQPITAEIQPADHLRFPDVPPHQLEFYAKETTLGNDRMSDGIARLFLSGHFSFKNASEPLTLSEIENKAQELNKAIRAHLIQTGKSTGLVAKLNPERNVVNALVTNELVMREIVDYYLKTAEPLALVEPLSTFVYIDGLGDTDQQKQHAVFRRQTYFLELGYHNRNNARDKEFKDWKTQYINNPYNSKRYMWLINTLRDSVVKGASPKDMLAKNKLSEQLTDSLLQLERDGLINLEMLTRMDPVVIQTFITKLEKSKLPQKPTIPESIFMTGFGTIAFKTSQPLRKVDHRFQEKPLFRDRFGRISRRAFIIGTGGFAMATAITGNELARLSANPPKEFSWIDRHDWQSFLLKAPRLTRPDITADFEGSSKICYSDGTPFPGLNRFSKGQIRETCSLLEMPEFLLQAVATSEDERIDLHDGVDPVGLARALVFGGDKGGGSTVAMQLVKHVFDNQRARTGTKKDIHLKVEEALGAWFLVQFRRDQARALLAQTSRTATETQIRKIANDSILADYLNTVNYGYNIAGIKTASQIFFNVSPNKLTKAQQIFLVGLPQGPVESDPRYFKPETGKKLDDGRVLLFSNHPAVKRFSAVLKTLESRGKLSSAETKTIKDEMNKNGGILIAAPSNPKASAALEYTILQLNNVPDSQIARRPNTVVTTFDRQITEEVDAITTNALGTTLTKYGANNVDVVVRRVDTGELIAVSGRPSFPHPVGSVAKIITTAVVLAGGETPDTQLDNSPLKLRLPEGDFTTQNFIPESAVSSPTPTLDESLKQSYNNTFVRLMTKYGVMPFLEMWQRLGLSDHMDTENIDDMSYLATLGANPWTNANRISSAMTTFARNGIIVGSAAIKTIRTIDGSLLYAHDIRKSAQQVVDPRVGRMFMEMLENPTHKLKALQSLDNRYAAKTGTSSNSDEKSGPFNGWCAGYVTGKDGKQYQITVVAYNFDGTFDVALNVGATGETTAVPIYRQIADFLYDDY